MKVSKVWGGMYLLAVAPAVWADAWPQTIGPVTATQSLWSLAKDARGDAPVSMYQMIVALKERNPSAFMHGNVHQIQQGAVLVLPSLDEVAAIDATLAQRRVEADAAPTAVVKAVSNQSARTKQSASSNPPVDAAMTVRTALTAVTTNETAVASNSQTSSVRTATARNSPVVRPSKNVQPWYQQIRSESTLGVEQRVFAQQGLQQQAKTQSSADFLQEWSWQSEQGRESWVFSPYFRWDQRDPERHLIDIRQAVWAQFGTGWELKVGIDQVFWGVTESLHLVDIINQTDTVAQPDGEAKLGQPLLQFSWHGDWGQFQSYLLPYFRERTFAGPHGRLRLPLPILIDQSRYESSKQQRQLDYALRYAKQIDQFDIALSWFDGTAREPLLTLDPMQGGLIPYYPRLQQIGLEGQWIVDSWIWKLEAIHRDLATERSQALVAGFEYTAVGVFDTVLDIGWLMEYQYDNRTNQALVLAQRDLFVGARLSFNDEAGSELLFGVVQDLDESGTRSGLLEASTRLSNNMRLSLDAWFFHTTSPAQPLWWFRRDDYVQLGIDIYF